ncbi:MAG TPA: hypothetical protein VM328_10215 [Fimbriimonadaceae bacterium]|nr:hypothetical protein [Fimbriimonadaceae bacterium]
MRVLGAVSGGRNRDAKVARNALHQVHEIGGPILRPPAGLGRCRLDELHGLLGRRLEAFQDT